MITDDDDRVPVGRVIAFPDLAQITPSLRGNRYARVHARLAAFYESIEAQIVRTNPLPPEDVWMSPGDYEQLRAWVEWPLHYVAAGERRRILSWVWLDSAPSISKCVLDGQIVITEVAYPERRP